MTKLVRRLATLFVCACCLEVSLWAEEPRPSRENVESSYSQALSLDGSEWLLGIDPDNVGRAERWFSAPRPNARPTQVPWVIQDVFPDYHGVAWYWREFECPENPDSQGRYLLRFWNVDYLGEVWVNDKYIGMHEGADGPFVLDATEAIEPGRTNRLAVRVLNPKDEPIDGIVLKQTPHRNKTCNFTFGCDYNHGGLEGSVELLIVPAVRIADLFVKPNWQTGSIAVQIALHNALQKAVSADLSVTVAPARDGTMLRTVSISQTLEPGETIVNSRLQVDNARRWELDDPFLYRVSAEVGRSESKCVDEQSVRCGFRDFRLEHGYFHLNGRRTFLRCSHTGNTAPIGIHLPFDRDWFRRDLINVKAMGFNAVRFIAGLPTRHQLDLCDELGLLVYEEPYSAWLLDDSPQMTERFNRSTAEMIRRDRNHASVVIWGLLNETHDGPVFRHAVATLPLVRSLDDSRLVLLSSGRFDCQLQIGSVSNPGSEKWQSLLGAEGRTPTEKLATIYPSCKGAGDTHIYPQVPHNQEAIRLLREFNQGNSSFFLSEYGVSSPVDLIRVARHYEQRGKQSSAEALFYREALDRFLADWQRWKLAEIFGRPEDFFTACLTRMSGQRLVGINAIRANPLCNGYSLTGTVDQGYSGEGLTTTFRELKPGTCDALFDGLAPLRWCLFVEPYHVYRGQSVRLEAVLANEDVLVPGDYPVRLDVLDANSRVVHSQQFNVTIPAGRSESPTPLALSVFDQEISAEWPAGKYRFLAKFERGAAAAGGAAEFYVSDAAGMPDVGWEVVVWGHDAGLSEWLGANGVRVQPLEKEQDARRQLIVASGQCPGPNKKAAYRDLLRRLAHGSNVVFLTPQLLVEDQLRIPCRGQIVDLPSRVYHKDEWNRRHPVFAGLPAGGLMDYAYYRNVLPTIGWQGDDDRAPAQVMAGAIHAAPGTGYASGLLLFADRFGAGQYIVNTLRVRDNLGKDPAAERLLRNLVNFAAQKRDELTAPLSDDVVQRIADLGL